MAYRILATAALAVALAVPALAADEIRPAGPPIVLQPSSGTAFEVPKPIGSVFIANPEIANVQVYSIEAGGKALLYVFAKAPGRTSLYALDADGGMVLSRTVDVPGPKTVRVLRGNHRPEIWSEEHEPPTRQAGTSLEDLPPGSTITVPVGGARQ